MRLTEEEYSALQTKMRKGRVDQIEEQKKKHSNAKPTEVDGIKFPSKAEARRYQELKMLQNAGDIHWFIRQPRFDLGGRPNTTYSADFLIMWMDGRITVEDVKGRVLDAFKRSKKQVEALYPIEIEVVK